MRYAFHGHESSLDLADVVAFEPELVLRAANAQGEPNREEAVSFVLDLFGAMYVREQRVHLETIGRSWVIAARRTRDDDDRHRIRAIPERLSWRFDSVWREGRVALHLMLRAVALRTGCSYEDAPLHVTGGDVGALMAELVDGLRAGFAATVDAAVAIEMLERSVDGRTESTVSAALGA